MGDVHAGDGCAGVGLCPECNQRAMADAFQTVAGAPADVCPSCGQPADPDAPVRMTEAVIRRVVRLAEFNGSHAPAGSPAGGQFASINANGEGTQSKSKGGKGRHAKGTRSGSRSGRSGRGRATTSRGTLGYHAGYGQAGGDPRVKQLQAALNRLGLRDAQGHRLKLDGKLGPKTTAAIKAAQKALGLQQTGTVSAALLRKLTTSQKLTPHAAAHSKVIKTPKATKVPKKAPPAYVVGGVQEAAPRRIHLQGSVFAADELVKVVMRHTRARRAREVDPSKPYRNGVEITMPTTEAMIGGSMSFDDISAAVRAALQKRAIANSGVSYAWAYIADLTTTDVVYACGSDDLMQSTYEVDAAGEVTLGDPSPVVRTYAPLPAAMAAEEDAESPEEEAAEGDGDGMTESRDRIDGRVMEAKGSDASGARIFRVRLIAYGDSKNGRRYLESVMRDAAPLYEGARAYDHHRDEAELRSSTIAGLIGTYRDVEAEGDGLYADLHLLPSATHAAEALDASLAAQEAGLTPLVGVSHDVMATYKPITSGGRRMQEATAITKVNSADLVADPAAGGKATRMVAGGITGTLPENEEDNVPTKEEILAVFAEATDEELAGVGLARATEADEDERAVEATSIASPKNGWMAKAMIRQKVEDAGLPVAVVESLTESLPDRVTESDVDAQIASLKAVIGVAERAGLAPGVGRVQVTQESREKQAKALDAFFASDFSAGYRSFREAFIDITGSRPRGFLDEDFNRTMLRESMGVGFDSGSRRSTESADTTTWNLVLGDSITRRLVAEYEQPSLQTWRQIVSSIVPIGDFRTQRIDRIGGYGTLPAVNQGQPYQPLTTPTNEEVTYAITKRGGTEDLTLEMIANDDIRAIVKIPVKLGLAAAQTLYRFVWDLLNPGNNPTIYDGTGLWTGHNNAATNVLSQTNLSAARKAMRTQAAYGDTADILSLTPKILVACNTLEELAWQLCTSAVAIPAVPAGPVNTPNIHQGLTPLIVDYWSTTTGWALVADPNMCPTVEMGFYQGRETPELFTQSDPNIGSMFDADKVTYKIRHIYSGAFLDYRGVYRGNT